jgi:hypothetical protein
VSSKHWEIINFQLEFSKHARSFEALTLASMAIVRHKITFWTTRMWTTSVALLKVRPTVTDLMQLIQYKVSLSTHE